MLQPVRRGVWVVLTLCLGFGRLWAADGGVRMLVPAGLAAQIQGSADDRQVDVPATFDVQVNGQPVPVTVDDAGNCGFGVAARANWPHPHETGLLAMRGPAGTAWRFTSGYLTCKGLTDVATGDHWTLSCWLRPDDPDWGMTIQRGAPPSTQMRPVIVGVGDHMLLRLCRMRPEIQLGAWHAWAGTRLPVGRWTHLAVVRDGAAMRFYIDGRLDTLTPSPQADGSPAAETTLGPLPDPPAQPTGVLRVAGYPLSSIHPNSHVTLMSDKFIGGMDGITLENRAWSAAEISAEVTAHRAQAEKLSQHPSVLRDPVIGDVSRIAGRAGEDSAAFLKRTAWWREAKFGLFSHWGPVSLTKKEISWSRGTGPGQTPPEVYDNLYKQFNPVQFDPDVWAQQINAAGMKYAVLIAKHHDGFCEWPTKTNEYNIAFSPYKKDPIALYVAGMRKAGVRVGLYFSGSDFWFSDKIGVGQTQRVPKTDEYDIAQLRELLGNYGPIDELWFDMWGVAFPEMYTLQPTMLVNDRLAGGDFQTPENFMIEHPIVNPNGSDGLWETCSGTGGCWAYPSDKPGFDARYTVRHLVEVVAKGGNWLCNVAPRETGALPTSHMDMLKQAGDWLRANAESVYGTHRTHLGRQPFGWTTANATTLYLHVFAWPGQTLVLPDLYDKATDVYLLTGHVKLPFHQDGATLTITLPAAAPDPVDTVIAIRVAGVAQPPVMKGTFTGRARGGEAIASAQTGEVQAAGKAFDGDYVSKWFETAGPTGWLQYHFGNGERWAITQYSLITAGDVPERDPKDWQFQGSQDGVTWVTLDEQRNQRFMTRSALRVYPLVNTTPYAYYRLNITANNGAPGIQLSELRLQTLAWVAE